MNKSLLNLAEQVVELLNTMSFMTREENEVKLETPTSENSPSGQRNGGQITFSG